MCKKSAFTLLEVILVLILIGVLYMYTQQHGKFSLEKETYKTTAKATYSILTKATTNILAEGGFANKFHSDDDIIDSLHKYLKVIKVCSNSQAEQCWSETWLWGDQDKSGLQLQTLQYMTADLTSETCEHNRNIPNTCGMLYVDTNGSNKPNEVGKDILLFYITMQGFIPAGIDEDTVTKGSDCDLKNGHYAWGCTAKLLGME